MISTSSKLSNNYQIVSLQSNKASNISLASKVIYTILVLQTQWIAFFLN